MSRTRIPLEALRNPQADLVERLQMSTAEIGLSVRTTNVLAAEGIATIEELLQYSPARLLEIRNFGEKQLQDVRERLAAHGLRLPGDDA